MSLRTVSIDRAGDLSDAMALDRRVCTCCQTDAAVTEQGAVVVYRDRSPDEVRDISVVRLQGQTWSEPSTVHEDGWRIEGCPVNGPAVAALADRVAVVWFTAAQNDPRVLLSFSADGGATFDSPLRIFDGSTLGRVDVELLEDGSAVVLWVAITAQGEVIRLAQYEPAGKRGKAVTMLLRTPGRTTGFPRMTRDGNDVYIAWTQPGEVTTVRTAVFRFEEFELEEEEG